MKGKQPSITQIKNLEKIRNVYGINSPQAINYQRLILN